MQNPELKLDLRGMTCAACVARVEKSLRKVAGVKDVAVNLVTEQALLRLADPAASAEASHGALEAVKKLGYQAYLAKPDEDLLQSLGQRAKDKQRELAAMRTNLGWALILTLPVFALEMGSHLIPAVHHWVGSTLGPGRSHLIQAILTSLVLFGPGRHFFILGIPNLWRATPEMNSLVALGAGLAWALSIIMLIAPVSDQAAAGSVFFEAAAVMVSLILLGRWLEARARVHTGDAISGLIALQPGEAMVDTSQGPQLRAVSSIYPGDVLVVRPGDAIALDAQVIDGYCEVNEAMLTGEAAPVVKQPGDLLHGGTVNTSGAVSARVTASVGAGRLAQIIHSVHQAQASRLPVQDLIDRIAMWFVPVVLGIALITGLVWWFLSGQWLEAFVTAITVIIVACPCAMGLATPISIVVAVGRAARAGLLLREGRILQSLTGIRVIAFDKTGTLTDGKLRLGQWVNVSGNYSDNQLLQWAASAEQYSEHPTARALQEAAGAASLELLPITGFQAFPGRGIAAQIDSVRFMVGSLAWMAESGMELPREARGLALARDGKVQVWFETADTIRPEAAATVRDLIGRGIKVAIVSGDHEVKVQLLAKSLAVDEVFSQRLPEQKVAVLEDLRARFGAVAFVGDGINDAPVLARSDAGFAMGAGSAIATSSADIVLARDDLRCITEAFDLAQDTMRNIKQNLFWAFGYNAALIPLAAGVFKPWLGWSFSPMAAAAAMALSSVFVVFNALRLRKA